MSPSLLHSEPVISTMFSELGIPKPGVVQHSHLPTPESLFGPPASCPGGPQQPPLPRFGSLSAPLHRENNFIKDFPQLADGLLVIPLPVEEQCRGVLSEPLPDLQLLTGKTHTWTPPQPSRPDTWSPGACESSAPPRQAPPGLPLHEGRGAKGPAISWAPTMCWQN